MRTDNGHKRSFSVSVNQVKRKQVQAAVMMDFIHVLEYLCSAGHRWHIVPEYALVGCNNSKNNLCLPQL